VTTAYSKCNENLQQEMQFITDSRKIYNKPHHTEKMEAGLKGLHIPEITLKYPYITRRIATL